MSEDFEVTRAQMRVVCFSMARVILILAVTVLATECLFPSRDRSLRVIGSSLFLVCSCVFSMILTRPRRTPKT